MHKVNNAAFTGFLLCFVAIIFGIVIFIVVNVYDLIVLDWGVFCHSQKLRIPGTEDMEKEYKDYMFHVRGACIGIVLGLVVALLSGGIIHLMSAI